MTTEVVLFLQDEGVPDFDRRKRRLEAASKRLGGQGIAEAIAKARQREPLTEDEFVVSSFGFLRGEPR
jgi:hypothetical protein